MTTISHCLFFDRQAEEAARFYVSVFKGKLGKISHYTEVGFEAHGMPKGTVMTVDFEILGQKYLALNGNHLPFNQSFSMMVYCETQAEVDEYWSKLTAQGGEEVACGWLRDKFGVSWQITPAIMHELVMNDQHPEKSKRAMSAMMKMKKLDIQKLKDAFDGKK